MGEILTNLENLDSRRWPGIARATDRFLEENPEAVLEGQVDELTGDLVLPGEVLTPGGRVEKPYMYRYERARRGLPPLVTPRALAGRSRAQFIARQLRRVAGEEVTEPDVPQLTSVKNSKLNRNSLVHQAGRWVTRHLAGTRILSWSVPSGETCPASSAWCSTHCYAKKGRFAKEAATSVYWVYRWHWALIEHEPSETMSYVLSEISDSKAKAFRIHPSGDFKTRPYLDWWIRLIERAHREIDEEIWFFFYTRMWWSERLRKRERLLEASAEAFARRIRHLYRMPRVVGWASCDPSMPLPPASWRRAYIVPRGATARYGTSPAYARALERAFLRCPSQRWGNVWARVNEHFRSWPAKGPAKVPKAVPEKLEIHGRAVDVRKELRLPRTCEDCRFCYTPRIRHMLFGEH